MAFKIPTLCSQVPELFHQCQSVEIEGEGLDCRPGTVQAEFRIVSLLTSPEGQRWEEKSRSLVLGIFGLTPIRIPSIQPNGFKIVHHRDVH